MNLIKLIVWCLIVSFSVGISIRLIHGKDFERLEKELKIHPSVLSILGTVQEVEVNEVSYEKIGEEPVSRVFKFFAVGERGRVVGYASFELWANLNIYKVERVQHLSL